MNHKMFDEGLPAAVALAYSKNIPYVETDFYDFIVHDFLFKRINSKISVYGDELRIMKNYDSIDNILKHLTDYEPTPPIITWINARYGFVEGTQYLIKITTTAQTIRLELHGDKDAVSNLNSLINSNFEVVANYVEWVTSQDMNSVKLPLLAPRGITNSSYPFIEGGVDNFVNEYMNSKETVLLLIGPPGTGKSSFIRYILSLTHADAMVTYDPDVMKQDAIFATYAESDASVLLFEDADNFLGSRVEGNVWMHRFLNSSDGVVSSAAKKLIFSTNLDNVHDIDSALIRPGRCFSVVKFRGLTLEESQVFLKERNMDESVLTSNKKEYTLAELYSNSHRSRTIEKRKIGFGR